MVPTSMSSAPLRAMMSGTRKEPPISTSSPREMATFFPAARAESMRKTAEALLLTTTAASAPVREQISSSTWSKRLPRRPVSRLYSRLE